MNKVDALLSSKVNVELLFSFGENGDAIYGCRLRPWKNSKRDGKMVLGSGYTIEDALCNAYDKAEAGRWERLDWTARPWDVAAAGVDGALDL